jgi:osmotically-inducible protein OsmY
MTSRTLTRAIVAVAAALATAIPAAADEASAAARLESRIQQAVKHDASVSVAVENGRVTLKGFALTIAAERAIDKQVKKLAPHAVNEVRLTPEERSDAAIRTDVEDAVLGYPYYTVFDGVDAAVKDGVVVLGGSVQQPYRKDEIDARVARVPGIRALHDDIQVQPASLSDDALRVRLLRSIYGNELFSRYAYWPDPPIRILVDRGHVTLVGYVPTRVEQVVVGSLARQTWAFSVDNRVKLDSERRAGEDAKPKANPNVV